MKKKVLSFLLCVIMGISMMTLNAVALEDAEVDEKEQIEIQTEEESIQVEASEEDA